MGKDLLDTDKTALNVITSNKQTLIAKFQLMGIILNKINGGRLGAKRVASRLKLPSTFGYRFLSWNNYHLTKMQARNLIKWFLGHKYDANLLPFTNTRRNKIRSKKALRIVIVKGVKDNLSALKLLDEYGLLDKINSKRRRKPHLKSKWTDQQIIEEYIGVFGQSELYMKRESKRSANKIRALLKRIEKLEDRLGIKRKRRK